ncbi:uncharacterized protein METZ01_LOCUS456598, partial [marine metagenome]
QLIDMSDAQEMSGLIRVMQRAKS